MDVRKAVIELEVDLRISLDVYVSLDRQQAPSFPHRQPARAQHRFLPFSGMTFDGCTAGGLVTHCIYPQICFDTYVARLCLAFAKSVSYIYLSTKPPTSE
jgi:hypothetical protein